MLVVAVVLNANSNFTYMGKFEVGRQNFQHHYMQYDIDPNSGWKGYNLNDQQNGIEVSVVNAIRYKKLMSLGIGIGYLNYEGIHGVCGYGDMEFVPFDNIISPISALRFGVNHIWNQYSGGSGSMQVEFGAGLNVKLSDNLDLYALSGVLFTQEAFFIPIRLGIRF